MLATTALSLAAASTSDPARPLPLHEPRFAGNEWTYVKDCLDTGWVSSAGAYVGRFEADLARRCGKLVEMTRKEFATLRLLVARAGEVVTRDELLNEVWGYESYPVSRTVDNHIAGLRAKLERDPARPVHIRTVHGVGYKFVHHEAS